tara:strand:- start:392 stop:808 length:417 start_codon:yes stop_codon:yes gene_type:complete
MDLYVFEVLERVQKAKKKEDKIKILKSNESWALKDIIRGSIDTSVVWNLPKGKPPYKAALEQSHPANLLRENVKFKYFVKGGPGEKLPPFKREAIFIGMLEGIHPEDAQLVVNMINKDKPKGIGRKLIEEAFPNLLRD